jgi:MFS superfamily sulfate permease-like transporter
MQEAAPRPGGAAGLLRDVLAGLTLVAITVPEQMATAGLGGFEPQVGLYAFVGATVGFAIAGASRILTAGADSTITPIFAGALAVLAAGTGGNGLAASAVTLALLVAAILLIAGMLRLGWIADLLSTPIVTGFLVGIAVHIAASQLPDAMGVGVPKGNLFERLTALAGAAGNSNPWAVAIAGGVLIAMLASERIDPRIPGALIAVAAATAAVLALGLEHRGVAVLGSLPNGLPTAVMPVWRFDSLTELVPLALLVALIVMMQTAAVSRAFVGRDGSADVNRDYIGLGAANLAAALLGSFPVNASPPRTAVVHESGGTSQLGALIAAAIVAVLALAGGRLLAPVPRAALAGILFFVAVRIVRAHVIATVARQAPGEAALIALTAIAVIALPIPSGVAAGIGFSLLHGVWISTRTRVDEFCRVPGTTIWWPAGPLSSGETVSGILVLGFQAPLLFANAETFRRDAMAALARHPETRLVVLEASGIAEIDYTAAQTLLGIIGQCRMRGIDFAIARLGSARAELAMRRFGVLALIGDNRLFHSVAEAIAAVAENGR